MRKILLTCIAAILTLLSFSPISKVPVKGQVTDDTGKPISGASVKEKGTNNGTSTDANGGFTISVNHEGAILIFSAVGYTSKELPAKVKEMKIKLSAASTKLEEIVVSGYGTKRSTTIAGVYASPSQETKTSGYYPQPYAKAGPPLRKSRRMQDNDIIGNSEKLQFPVDKEFNTEDYDGIVENRFLTVADNALSTFSIDVDAASYSNVRRYLQMNQLPPAGSVRIEEMINYFHYDYPQPLQDAPFSINTEISACPWNNNHRLVLIGLQGKTISNVKLPPSNLVFLIDVSGSMQGENRLPLVKASMKLLVDQLREEDRVSIVVYAGSAGLVLPSTSGEEKIKIKDAIDKLEAGGSTAGGEGIKLAYRTAKDNFLKTGNNRVILCTDGDFNVGVSSDAELERMIGEERQSGVFLTILGYGMGNYKDNKMQKLADKGNGNHAYIDGLNEAKKVLVNEFGGTLFTIAKDVKLQIEFNPEKVQSYRLIGYENRLLNKEDFNNDKKDAGELGSGHTVTALYEIIPTGVTNDFLEKVDPLKYGKKNDAASPVYKTTNELMTIKFRYKNPDGDVSRLIEHPVIDKHTALSNTSTNFRFAAAIAEFGMLLRDSEFKQSSSFDNASQLAQGAIGRDVEGYRAEFLQLISGARSLGLNR